MWNKFSDSNYAAAFPSFNVNICSKGINSSYLIYAWWQADFLMVYQPLYTFFIPSPYHACITSHEFWKKTKLDPSSVVVTKFNKHF